MNGEIIESPAYIDLSIPSPVADWVRSVRAKFDPDRAILPAEITLTGSSGLGHVETGQTLESAAAEMDRIASRFKPFYAQFDKVERFPCTDIYFLTVKDPEPFNAVHRAFAESAIRFNVSQYPYRPHCTLKLRSSPSDAELLELFFLDVPREPFLISEMTMYAMPDTKSCELLHASLLGENNR